MKIQHFVQYFQLNPVSSIDSLCDLSAYLLCMWDAYTFFYQNCAALNKDSVSFWDFFQRPHT